MMPIACGAVWRSIAASTACRARLTAAISIGPAIEVKDNGIARTCGRNEKLEISGGAALLPVCESSLKHGKAICEPIETRTSVDRVPNKLGYRNPVAHRLPMRSIQPRTAPGLHPSGKISGAGCRWGAPSGSCSIISQGISEPSLPPARVSSIVVESQATLPSQRSASSTINGAAFPARTIRIASPGSSRLPTRRAASPNR
jgi:hypothetical protein